MTYLSMCCLGVETVACSRCLLPRPAIRASAGRIGSVLSCHVDEERLHRRGISCALAPLRGRERSYHVTREFVYTPVARRQAVRMGSSDRIARTVQSHPLPEGPRACLRRFWGLGKCGIEGRLAL